MISWIPLLFSLPISNVSASPTGLPLKYIFNLSPYPLPTMLPLRTSFNRTGAETPPGVPAYTLSHLWNIFCRASRMAFENIVRSCHSPALNSPVVSVSIYTKWEVWWGPTKAYSIWAYFFNVIAQPSSCCVYISLSGIIYYSCLLSDLPSFPYSYSHSHLESRHKEVETSSY